MSTDQPNGGRGGDDSYDPHRFDGERTRRKSNVFGKIVMAFVITLAVIGGTAYYVKTKIARFMSERSQPSAAVESMKVESKGPETRKFEDVVRAVLTPASAPLPAASAPAPIPVVTSEPGGTKGPSAPVRPPEPPDMMLGGAAAVAEAASIPPRMRTIEEYGEAVADGMRQPTTTPQVTARHFGDRSYVLARGSFIPCVLETQLVSNLPGSSNCVVPEHVYSENGRVLLLEKGSKIVGEYKSEVKQGQVRIAILWQRIRTPTGVVIDVDSPSTDATGAMGVEGGIDYHWPQRIGAALLISLIGDAIEMEKSKQTGVVVVAGGGTQSEGTTKKLAEQVLQSTINIPPTIMKNRGDRVMVYLNRDLWFNTVYSHTQAAAP